MQLTNSVKEWTNKWRKSPDQLKSERAYLETLTPEEKYKYKQAQIDAYIADMPKKNRFNDGGLAELEASMPVSVLKKAYADDPNNPKLTEYEQRKRINAYMNEGIAERLEMSYWENIVSLSHEELLEFVKEKRAKRAEYCGWWTWSESIEESAKTILEEAKEVVTRGYWIEDV